MDKPTLDEFVAGLSPAEQRVAAAVHAALCDPNASITWVWAPRAVTAERRRFPIIAGAASLAHLSWFRCGSSLPIQNLSRGPLFPISELPPALVVVYEDYDCLPDVNKERIYNLPNRKIFLIDHFDPNTADWAVA